MTAMKEPCTLTHGTQVWCDVGQGGSQMVPSEAETSKRCTELGGKRRAIQREQPERPRATCLSILREVCVPGVA